MVHTKNTGLSKTYGRNVIEIAKRGMAGINRELTGEKIASAHAN